MHTVHAKKNKKYTETGKVDFSSIGKGHQAHRSGGGRHQDRRTARNRTRSQQNRNALAGW